MGSDKRMTYIYLASITQSSFTALKILCPQPTHPSLPNPCKPLFCFALFFYYLHSFVFSKMSYSRNHTVYRLLTKIGFFHVVICIEVSLMFFHGLIAHFFLALDNIPSCRFTTAYPFTFCSTTWLLPNFHSG